MPCGKIKADPAFLTPLLLYLHCIILMCRFTAMNFFINALSLYMLILALLPCADGVDCSMFGESESVHTELFDGMGNGDNNGCHDYCTPFCTCSCCQTTLRSPTEFSFVVNAPIIIFSEPSLSVSLFKDLAFPNDIWQPPKQFI